MRIFFIPGLGEEKWIFDKIAPFITGEKVFVDNWALLKVAGEKDLDAGDYAAQLIERFQITNYDIVIGHSMGGWIALQIKNLTRCQIIQISSFTDIKKVLKPANRNLLFWLAKKGFGLNTFVMNVLIFLGFRTETSKEAFRAIFKKIMIEDKLTFAKQLQVVYNPVPKPITVDPDARIHSKKDQIISAPDETFIEVPGDHFALYTFPETVYVPINHFLKSIEISEESR